MTNAKRYPRRKFIAGLASGAGLTLVSRCTAEPFAGPEIAVRPVREALTSRYALIHPEAQTPMSLARAFALSVRTGEVFNAERTPRVIRDTLIKTNISI